jgi:hypothetical protein
VLIEGSLHHRTLHASAPPVDQPHLAEASLVRGPHVLLHNVNDIARREGMKVERIFDRQFVHGAGRT